MSTQKKKSQADGLALESTMKSVEKLLEKLENSETPLEQSLLAFEEGIQLIRSAQKTLSEAEQRVKLLLEKDGSPAATDFNYDEANR
jgi:exodeoxyribonuclease VII small subunit